MIITRVYIGLLVCTISSNALIANAAELIEEDDLLEFIYDSLRTCSGVSKVTRSGSDFRVLEDTNFRKEFSLKDVYTAKGYSGQIIELKCSPPGCVAKYIGSGGQWKEIQPDNSVLLRCDPDLVARMKTVVRYYRQHYSE